MIGITPVIIYNAGSEQNIKMCCMAQVSRQPAACDRL